MLKKVFSLLLVLICFASLCVSAADTVSEETDPELEQIVQNRKADVTFLHIGNYATVSDGTLKWIDRNNKEVKPYIKNDRTMVPLRFLAEEMGATVGYNDQTRGITITLGETVMELLVDQTAYSLNGTPYEMDCPAEIFEDRTFVPVRFVSEALGKSVFWLNDARIVVITPVDAPWNADNSLEQAVLAEVQQRLSPIARNDIDE